MPRAILILILAAPVARAAGVSLGDGNPNARRLWESGLTAVLDGNPKSAEALWQRCLKADPGSRECRAGLVLLGHPELLARKEEEAPPPAEDGLREDAKAKIGGRRDPANAIKNWKLGTAHFERGDIPRTRDAWTRCLELDPSNADCREGLARIGAGAPPNPEAARRYALGMRHLMAGEAAKARAEFAACLKADPGHPDCAQGLERADR